MVPGLQTPGPSGATTVQAIVAGFRLFLRRAVRAIPANHLFFAMVAAMPAARHQHRGQEAGANPLAVPKSLHTSSLSEPSAVGRQPGSIRIPTKPANTGDLAGAGRPGRLEASR